MLPLILEADGEQVRFTEIAVVSLGLFGAHLLEGVGVFVPFKRPGFDAVASFSFADLAFDLFYYGFAHGVNGVNVLNLGLGVENSLALFADGDVGVASQVALFHISFGDADPAQKLAQAGEVLGGLVRGAQVGGGDHFDQRYTAAVEVNQTAVARSLGFACVFFDVHLPDAHTTDVSLLVRRGISRDRQV